MTAAVLHRPTEAARPRLIPVPDCEPPAVPWVGGVGWPPQPFAPVPVQRRRPRRQPIYDVPEPVIEHRRFAPVLCWAETAPAGRVAVPAGRNLAAAAGRIPAAQAGQVPATAAGRNLAAAAGRIPAAQAGQVPVTPPQALAGNAPPPAPGAGIRIARITAESMPPWSMDSENSASRTATAELPPVLATATVLCRAVLEVLAGRRDINQLRAHCAADVFGGLQERIASSPPLISLLISVTTCQPADGIAEVSVVFRAAGRARAMALRLKGVDGRWRITVLELA